MFDSITIFYNNTEYATLDATTMAKYGLTAATPSDFFKGELTDYYFKDRHTFEEISTFISKLSTV